MTLSIPESDTAEGNVKVTFIPGAIADLEAVTPTEANNAANVALDVFMLQGWAGLTSNQNTGQDRRFASKEGFDRLGRSTRSLAPLQYTDKPQETGSDPGNKAKTALAEGTTGYVMIGRGKDPADTWADDDQYVILPVECGVQNPDVTGSDEFAPLTITQTLGVTGILLEGVVAT